MAGIPGAYFQMLPSVLETIFRVFEVLVCRRALIASHYPGDLSRPCESMSHITLDAWLEGSDQLVVGVLVPLTALALTFKLEVERHGVTEPECLVSYKGDSPVRYIVCN